MIEPHTQKHLTVRNYILGLIRSGRLRPGEKAPSEQALATRFKINKTTCNKAVAMLVADGYLARRIGAGTYAVEEFAKNAPMIGVLINLRPGSFFAHLLVGIQEEAALRGYGVLFFQSPTGDFDLEKFRQYVLATGIKGLVINQPFAKVHNVYLNTAAPVGEVMDQVQTDDFHGGYLLGRHLVEMGHKHVAFISQDITRHDLLERARGFQKAIDESKSKGFSTTLHNFSKSKHNLSSVLQKIFRSDHRITAIAFDSIHVASEGFRIIKRLDLTSSENISIVGFGDLEPGEQTVRLTTIQQHPLVLGHTAAEALIDRIEGRLKGRVKITIAVELAPGDSVADLRGSRQRGKGVFTGKGRRIAGE
jgi:GntR family transcriptional regulator of arabinose operon